MSEKDFYLGPLGYLKALPCPDEGLTRTVERYGGVHQALSGARSMDILGYRAVYELEFSYLLEDQTRWLEALHLRTVPGPFHLIDPMATNRISRDAAFIDPVSREVSASAGFLESSFTDFPTAVGMPVRSSTWSNITTGDTLSLDAHHVVPVLNGESLMFSVYLKGSGSFSINEISQPDGTVAASTPVTLTSSWERYTLTDAPTASGVSYEIESDGGTEVSIACAQVENGVTATEWQMGGGAPLVLIDQLPRTSPLITLTALSVTLLEV